jgi:DNA-binding MarR family transcriptional regulator
VGDSEQLRGAVQVLARVSRLLETADSGLTLPQYRMLSALRDGGQRSARLADRLAIRKPTATALADGLVAAGYAERESEPGDRRIVRLRMTPAGEAALRRADAAYAEQLSGLLRHVDDPAAVVSALLALRGALDTRAEALVAAMRRPAAVEGDQ